MTRTHRVLVPVIWLAWLGVLAGPAAAQLSREPVGQFAELKGASWRVFAVDTYPTGPITVDRVEEVKRQHGPSTWVVLVRDRSDQSIASYTMAAALVSSDGTTNAVQTLLEVKNLMPNQARRQEVRMRVGVLSVTDRVAFFAQRVGD
jgi:hypothetical protein